MRPETQKTFRPWQPESYRNEPFCIHQKLPDDDLVFFLLDVLDELDLTVFYQPYQSETRGAPPFEPAMMLTLLLYSYCIGIFSSRKIALACERNLAFLAIVGNHRPDFRTISDFRKLHLRDFEKLFLEVLRLAGEAGLVRLGNVSTDGTKVPGNASRHKAMSYSYMQKQEQRLEEEIKQLLEQAQQTDETEDAVHGSRRGDELPEELARREKRLEKIREAKARLEEQAKQAAEALRQRRAEEEKERLDRGQKRRGKEPAEPSEIPQDKAQSNFTDPEPAIMKQNNKGWEYSGNAQACVDQDNQIIVATDVTDQANDKQQAVPMAKKMLENLNQAGIAIATDENGQAKKIVNTLESGYYSEQAVQELEDLGIDPYVATGRQKHNPGFASPSGSDSSAQKPPSAKQKMQQKLQSEEGRKIYSRRKVIVEPVFGQIKGARGFRRFLLRGLEKIRAEWSLVCLTHNLWKLWRSRCAPRGK